MRCERTRTSAVLAAATGIVALGAGMLAAPAGAQLEEGTCPASVDTNDEGWICSMLILETPNNSPSDDQVELWSAVLAENGRRAVADGIVFSDASIEAKVAVVYETQLDRQPDDTGLAHWRERVQSARTEFAVEFGIFGSGEYLSQFASTEAFVNDQYQYYLGREASPGERSAWADRSSRDELSNDGITRAIATSAEAGKVRAGILYQTYVRRNGEAAGVEHWSQRAAGDGLYRTIVDFARSAEVVNTVGRIGVDNAAGTAPGSDPQQDLVVAPQEVVSTSAGEPMEITVLQHRDGSPLDEPLDLTLFPCPWVGATDSPVPFTDANDDDIADGIASTIEHQAYISEVNGEPTGGRELYVDDATTASDGILRFTVVAPSADCAVVAALDDTNDDRQLNLDNDDHADEPFGVTELHWG